MPLMNMCYGDGTHNKESGYFPFSLTINYMRGNAVKIVSIKKIK